MPARKKSRLTSRKGRDAKGRSRKKTAKASVPENSEKTSRLETLSNHGEESDISITDENATTTVGTAETAAPQSVGHEKNPAITTESSERLAVASEARHEKSVEDKPEPSSTSSDIGPVSRGVKRTILSAEPSLDVPGTSRQDADHSFMGQQPMMKKFKQDVPSLSKRRLSSQTIHLADEQTASKKMKYKNSPETVSPPKNQVEIRPDEAMTLFPHVEILHPVIYSDSGTDSDDDSSRNPHRKGEDIVKEQKSFINFFTNDYRTDDETVPAVIEKVEIQPIIAVEEASTSKAGMSQVTEIVEEWTKKQQSTKQNSSKSSSKDEKFPADVNVLFPTVEIIHPAIYSDSESDDEDKSGYRHAHRRSEDIIREQKSSINFFGEKSKVDKPPPKKTDKINILSVVVIRPATRETDLGKIETVPNNDEPIDIEREVEVFRRELEATNYEELEAASPLASDNSIDIEREVEIFRQELEANDYEDLEIVQFGPVEINAIPIGMDQRRRERLEEARRQDEFEELLNDADIERLLNQQRRLPTYLLAARRERVRQHDVGRMTMVCQHCRARYFPMESTTRDSYNTCCSKGKVVLQPLRQFPQELRLLFKNEHRLSREFQKNAIVYNNCFQFASVQANLRDLPGRGPYVYAVQGQIYHHYTDVNINRETYKCGPLYFLDPEEATRQRLENARNYRVNEELMRLLGDVLRRDNPFAAQYRHLRDVFDQQRAQSPDLLPNVCLEFVFHHRQRNLREHDMPEVDEVAVVYEFDHNIRNKPNMRVFLTEEDNGTRTIDSESEYADPLSYPLLFPRGELGWHPYIALVGANPGPAARKRVSVRQFYSYRLAVRFDDNDDQHFDVIRFGGKLTQRFIVDAYTKVEAEKLNWMRQHQDELHSEEYTGLRDYVYNRAERNNVPVGRIVILPSSFNLGPRSMMQRYQDAMAVVSKVGYPSLFITMTCNPKWPDIVNNIPAGHAPGDHPTIVCRVFQLKLAELIEELTVNHVMGVAIAFVYVIEFQKRGLPHAHILITLRKEDKPTDAVKIDQLVSAEIPDPAVDHELCELVGTHMIHGPCGVHNSSSVCMADDKCTKNFPKYWYNNTTIRNGRVNYRRRKNGREIEVRRGNVTHSVNNQWVVPYNRYLLLRYRTHINVEVCTNAGTVKYLFKYMFKGQDQALMKVTEQRDGQQNVQLDHNEISTYLNGRYMTPPEGAWHILSLPMHIISHHVERLPVHLPGRQNVVFKDGEERAAADDPRTTRLLQWFETNRTDPQARNILYPDFPHHYVWDRNKWKRRKQTNKPVVSRIYNVSLKNGELYYLRLLLLHVKGATSFDDLKTVDGRVCDSFQEACRQRNLLSEDREWVRSLTEASEKDMPNQMRKMFAYILVFGMVEDPPALWRQFADFMVEDFVKKRGLERQAAETAALRKIQFVLMVNGRRLSQFGLPEPENFDPAIEQDDFDVPQEQSRLDEMLTKLNTDQRKVYDAVMRAVDDDNQKTRLFFVQGAAGTGKTFLYNTIITAINAKKQKVVSVAWTGLAASLLKQGRTVHSRFRLPLAMVENSTSALKFQSKEGTFIREAKLIVWDEVSMSTKTAFDIVEKTLRFLADDQRPFGNKVVVLGGDFKQCLPVVLDGDQTTVVDACVKQSRHWPLFQSVTLTINMRVDKEEQEFIRWLSELGNGKLRADKSVPRRGSVGMPIQIPDRCVVGTLEQLIEKVFGDLKAGDVPNKAILTPINESCHEINGMILDKMRDKEDFFFLSADTVITDDPAEEDIHPIEFLNTLTPSGFPPHRLRLKEGTVVMLLKNFNVRANLCNGTRLLIKSLGQHTIEAERIGPDGALTGKTVLIPRVDFTSDADRTLPFILRRRQFPVRPAYAMTINKAQGQTFDTVGIYLPNPVFQHGQLYVAFSRGRRMSQIFVCVLNKTQQGKLLEGRDETYTINIVYENVL